MECLECNRNPVSTARLPTAVREKSPRSYTGERWKSSLGHFLFMSRLMPFCSLILPQASCDLFFPDLKREARVLFVLPLKSVKSEIAVRPICSSLISLTRGARALFLLGAGFYTNKIIIFVVSPSWRLSHCVYVRKEKGVVGVCKILQQLSAVGHFRLLMKYRHSFATVKPPEPLCSPRNKSTAL